jgi:hypothetical protein
MTEQEMSTMTDSLHDRIAEVLYRQHYRYGNPDDITWDDLEPALKDVYRDDADAVIAELGAIPDRQHTDDEGRIWEWCGGQPGTWAWRITALADKSEQRAALRELANWGEENQPDD